jgi:hypothetical protein
LYVRIIRAKYIVPRITVAIQRIVSIGKGQSLATITHNKIIKIANIVKMIIEKREFLIILYFV